MCSLNVHTNNILSYPYYIRNCITDIDTENILKKLVTGSFFLKYCKSLVKKPHKRFFVVDLNYMCLKWFSPRKSMSETVLFFIDIQRIVPGCYSDFLKTQPERITEFGIEVSSYTRHIFISADDEETWRCWLIGLHLLQQRNSSNTCSTFISVENVIRKLWALSQFKTEIDSNRERNLQVYGSTYSESQLQTLLNSQPIPESLIRDSEIEQFLSDYLTHKSLKSYFDSYSSSKRSIIDSMGISRFMEEVQMVHLNKAYLINDFIANLKKTLYLEDGLSLLGFNLFLTNNSNSVLNPMYSDIEFGYMDHPLHHYWISSSHNTYLTGDQMLGKSAITQYIDVLLNGCRCIELDCWDGSNGQPVIYHGRTLTGKISFESVIQVCRDYAFQVSPYPVTLSLEMHCSPMQIKAIGLILQRYLGNLIFYDREHLLLTPNSLKYHFIIKGRKPYNLTSLINQTTERSCLSFLKTQKPAYDSNSSLSLHLMLSSNDNEMLQQNLAATNGTENYYRLISFPGQKLTTLLPISNSNKIIHSSNERKFMKLAKKCSLKLAEFHISYLSRVYPSRTRILSSNFNPVPYWIYGCQMVALNFQMNTLPIILNHGLFSINDRSGYVLKPAFLRDIAAPFDPKNIDYDKLALYNEYPIILRLKIIGIQNYPFDTFLKCHQFSPKVKNSIILRIEGVNEDKVIKKIKIKTGNQNQMLDPNNVHEFIISIPSLAILVLELKCSDSSKKRFVAGNAVPVSAIRPGWLQLYDQKLRELPACGVLLHITHKIR